MPPSSAAAAPRAATRSPSAPDSAISSQPSSGTAPVFKTTQTTPISFESACAALPELWSPRIVGKVNDQYIKVARVHGSFPWHVHDGEDEMFYVLRGRLHIGRSDAGGGDVSVGPGEFFVVPAGVRHNTCADEETWLVLIETTSTLHTGSDTLPQTRTLADQLR